REHRSGTAASAELVDVSVAEELADDRPCFGRRHHLEVDLRTPTGRDLQQMTVAAREAARPREKRQQETRARAHVIAPIRNPGSARSVAPATRECRAPAPRVAPRSR